MKKKRRAISVFNLSFLDVVSCGFGAIILLLVILKGAEPMVVEKMSVDLTGLVVKLEQEIQEIRGETQVLNRELTARERQLSREKDKLARVDGDLSTIKGQFKAMDLDLSAQTRIEAQLETARQKLTEEMRHLQNNVPPPAPDSIIGGVPVDSEYIIFVIDTSGSMQHSAWPLVLRKMQEILAIYPRVKGIQVMNDMGDYMFSQYAGRWIPDSPARRKSILKRLASWKPFSNSSPVEGVTSAIRRFHTTGKRISIYIFGDDFSRGSIQQVVDTVNTINHRGRQGDKLVRIHAVGFPVLFTHKGTEMNIIRFAALMRRLAEDNNGSFVGL
ncbi:MAG: VWA domain-containing protein, partial [Deltaproteobacteria bacterium]|nr:VWA domain-containing protein [Deltaproteobacteria bacterium]